MLWESWFFYCGNHLSYMCCISNVHIIYNIFSRSLFSWVVFPLSPFLLKVNSWGSQSGVLSIIEPKGMIIWCRVLHLIPFRRSEHTGPNVILVYKSEQTCLQICSLRKHWHWIDVPKASITVHETFSNFTMFGVGRKRRSFPIEFFCVWEVIRSQLPEMSFSTCFWKLRFKRRTKNEVTLGVPLLLIFFKTHSIKVSYLQTKL